ncbi:PREDICTED: D-glucuronyl C5-epimerase [Wasmannia auropunctata]|uniref:D-glucuronyl C5-epimerase n=1 Tax=Wasmannia auropunctata TaxID=64793 RepID=UPI0005ED77E1|nr:PREDICTED: D-glucuronyl C5-epimerase [Wasmannia auropunctata]XP_011686133.1 PREDICTED: D-glucuronyl C5-epimerase [Wasmannia auropunctata]XP_011686134.1 PREDICTED: D-glucuronyl C5-epimerase [Wasmannia auropunctata]XP_011686135.1 PREDICTED: D-glucuronyl C5-epimerase [Wasmannia auropunctata]XP_011686136.1 PREDICTED: D-glucuronyl C5-epimerase [Wasmannia auropunctata]
MMMRLNFKTTLLVLVVATLSFLLASWNNCGSLLFHTDWKTKYHKDRLNTESGYQEIDCHINGDYSIGCRKEGDEVYIPFSFIHKYFEIYGKLATYDGLERFEWLHSYSKIVNPKGKYDPRGVFMTFENYNVEVRDRVKCISGTDGVPISTQWESQGYYYPTQIAQFGLSHYSKNLTEPEPHRKIVEDADKAKQSWNVPQGSVMNRVYDKLANSYALKFATPETSTSGISLKLDHVLDFVLKWDFNIKDNGSVTVVLQSREKKEMYYLHYVTNNIVLHNYNNHVYYGIGQANHQWRRLTRDLVVDLQKGLYLNDKSRKKLPRSKLKVVQITLYGSGMIDNMTLSTSEHMEQFYDAARWFVANQNVTSGGWPNPVRRKVASGMAILEPGWYSSMGQGHAISVLARAYYHSGEAKYLQAAIRGLRPFRLTSAKGGVAALFLGKYVWYEEYPTTPSSFILNGFIYSLIGLYDLKSIAMGKDAEEATRLFNQGMISLKSMLTLYDTGSGTTYDLRHFTLKTAPNLARWDYHSTHINQLLLLNSIDNDPIFITTAERWIGYMNGKRAAHN